MKERIAIIPCAGSSKRMGDIQVPKCLYEIMGKPSLVHLLDQLENIFSTFYIPISNNDKEINLYQELIPSEYLKKIIFIPSEPGSGDGQAILDALKAFDEKHIRDYVMVCWGDIFVKDISLIDAFLGKLESGYTESLVIPTKEEENPYVTYFVNKKNNLSKVAFQRRGEFFHKGLTDLSIFFIKPKPMLVSLSEMKNNQLNRRTENEEKKDKHELNFLDIVEYLHKQKDPAVTFTIPKTKGITSFNTILEAQQISDDLIISSKENAN